MITQDVELPDAIAFAVEAGLSNVPASATEDEVGVQEEALTLQNTPLVSKCKLSQIQGTTGLILVASHEQNIRIFMKNIIDLVLLKTISHFWKWSQLQLSFIAARNSLRLSCIEHRQVCDV